MIFKTRLRSHLDFFYFREFVYFLIYSTVYRWLVVRGRYLYLFYNCVLDLGDLRPWIESPRKDGSTISTVLDPSHMIKLVRNTLSDLGVLRNGAGELIKWEFIEALHHVQARVLLHFQISACVQQ
jgi:hypothetical protein